MDFALSEEQRLLQSTARDYFEKNPGTEIARSLLDGAATLPDLRPELAEMGFLGLLAAEEHGGSGGTVLDLAVVAEQAGRVIAPVPLTGTAARAVVLLQAAAAGGSAEAARLLAEVVEGARAISVADPAELSLSGGSLSGSTHPAFDAVAAQTVVTLAGGALVAVEVGSGVTIESREPIDPTRGLAPVRFDGAHATVLLGDEKVAAVWRRARDIAAIVLAAEDLGTTSAAVAKAVAYAKERVAFGRPIGSFQAVKHMLVDAYVYEEQLRSLVWLAAWTADEDPETLSLHASAAAAYASDAVERVAETLIQVHGGIGFTWEHDAHVYWRRAKVDRLLLGDAHEHRDRVARLLLEQAARIEPQPAR
jgi:alkylation response protein AidB-like acyl-CoA dehydrogenase